MLQRIVTGFDVSPAAAGAVATDFLNDLMAAGHLSEQWDFLAMDTNKLHRARQSVLTWAKEKDEVRATEEKIESIYFDGRKDKTRAMVPDVRGQLHLKINKKELVSVTWEPHGRYLTHFTPEPAVHPDKPAKKVAEVLYDVLDRWQRSVGKNAGTQVPLCHCASVIQINCHYVI